jgi:endoglycosylceramidase
LLIGVLAAAAVLECASHSSAQQAGPPPSGPALPVAPIGHQGRWLTDAEGRVLLVHGVNMVDKDPPYHPAAAGFSDADATWLAANGFLVVRIGILATGLMPTPGAVDTSYLQQVAPPGLRSSSPWIPPRGRSRSRGRRRPSAEAASRRAR